MLFALYIMSGLNSGPQILKPCMGKNMLLASACGRSDKACPVVIDHTVKRSVALPFIMYFLFYFKDRLVLHSIYPISTLNYNIFTWVLEKSVQGQNPGWPPLSLKNHIFSHYYKVKWQQQCYVDLAYPHSLFVFAFCAPNLYLAQKKSTWMSCL